MKPVLLLSLLFFAALAPSLPDLSRYHGDERYYTDAAITMMQSGDYLTPRYADGTARFRKPLLTYWVLCASYKVFGINVFASRFPFLLAGCGVVWLTWRLGRTLFGQSNVLSALVLAANVQTMTIATRSTPDILLCLFVTASLCGFAEILLRESTEWPSYALAYLGIGLAGATKGLWGLLPLLFATGYWLWHARHVPLKRFAPPMWVIAGVSVGLSWFVVAAFKYGRTSLQIFLEDQTMMQTEPVKWFLITNVLDYGAAVLRHFLPWSILALIGWRHVKPFARENRKALWFALGWFALVFIVFSFGFVRRTRYLLPTYPCIAVVLGAFLPLFAQQPWLRRTSLTILQIGIAAGVLAAIVGARLDWRLTIGGSMMAGVAVGLIKAPRLNALGIFVIVAFSVAMTCLRPLVQVNPAHAIARKLKPVAGQPVATLGTPPALNSQLRVVSAGRINPQEARSVPTNGVLLLTETWRDKVAAAGYQIEVAGFQARRTRGGDVWRAWRAGHRDEMFARNRQNYYVATRP